MAVNKVEFGNQTIMDITDTTADAGEVIEGEVFYTKGGVRTVGTLGDATQSTHGLMSAEDKIKLDNIQDQVKTISTPSSIMSFSDGAENLPMKVEIAINPVQNLNGQANPYPAGGGKNICPPIKNDTYQYVTTLTDSYGKTTITGTATGSGGRLALCTDAFTLPAGTYTFAHNGTGTWGYTLSLSENGGSQIYECRSTSSYTTFTLTESKTVVVGITIESGVTYNGTVSPQIEVGSQKTSYAPYSNICPISGFTGVDITRTGKNLLKDVSKTNGYFLNAFGVTGTDDNFCYTDLIPVEVGKTYNFTGKSTISSASNRRIHEYNSSGTWVRQATYQNVGANASYSLSCTIPSGTAYLKVSYGINDENANFLQDDLTNVYSFSWQSTAGTVYGGTLNVLTGELVVDRKIITLDGTQMQNNGKFDGTYNAVARWVLSEPAKAFTTTYPDAICDKLKVINGYLVGNFASWTNAQEYGYTFTINTDGTMVGISIPLSEGISSSTTMNTWLSNNNVTICYELATPIIYQLTALEVIKTLEGINNVWCDTGNINKITYYVNNASGLMNVDDKAKLDSIVAGAAVNDVQINNISILNNGVANIPKSTTSTLGLVRVNDGGGIAVDNNGYLMISRAIASEVKAATDPLKPIVPKTITQTVFYGLSKVAGVDLANETVTLGTYPETSKTAIQEMIGAQAAIEVIRL